MAKHPRIKGSGVAAALLLLAAAGAGAELARQRKRQTRTSEGPVRTTNRPASGERSSATLPRASAPTEPEYDPGISGMGVTWEKDLPWNAPGSGAAGPTSTLAPRRSPALVWSGVVLLLLVVAAVLYLLLATG